MTRLKIPNVGGEHGGYLKPDLHCFLTLVQGEASHEAVDFAAYGGEHGFVFKIHQHPVDERHDGFHVFLFHAAGGDGGGAHAETAGGEGRLIVEWHHVFVDGDVGFHQGILGLLAIDVFVAQVDEHEVVVGAAGNEVVAAFGEGAGHGLGVFDYLTAVDFVGWTQGLAEGDGFGGDDVLERTALGAGEHGHVEQVRHHFELALGGFVSERIREVFAHHDQPAAGSAQGFVGGGGDDVAVRHRVVEVAGGDEAGGVGDVGEQQGAHFIGYGTECGVVPIARVGRSPADDELGLHGASFFGNFTEIDQTGTLFYPIKMRFVELAAEIYRRAVGEVPAMTEVEAEDAIAGIEHSQHHRGIGLGARMGLHIGPLHAKELLGTVYRQLFDLVNHLATAIIALAGQSLGVFVGEYRAGRFHDLWADKVF